MKKTCDFIANWMGGNGIIRAILSLTIPASFSWIDTWAISPMLGIIMFGMGLTLSPHDFKIVFCRPKDIIIGCVAQFTIMPLLAWFLTWCFSLPKELRVREIGIAPIICGLLCQRFLPNITKRLVPYLPAFSSVAIALTVGIVVSCNADRLLGRFIGCPVSWANSSPTVSFFLGLINYQTEISPVTLEGNAKLRTCIITRRITLRSLPYGHKSWSHLSVWPTHSVRSKAVPKNQ